MRASLGRRPDKIKSVSYSRFLDEERLWHPQMQMRRSGSRNGKIRKCVNTYRSVERTLSDAPRAPHLGCCPIDCVLAPTDMQVRWSELL